eukprot:1081671-Pelagomonas_calceolata.AAC.5
MFTWFLYSLLSSGVHSNRLPDDRIMPDSARHTQSDGVLGHLVTSVSASSATGAKSMMVSACWAAAVCRLGKGTHKDSTGWLWCWPEEPIKKKLSQYIRRDVVRDLNALFLKLVSIASIHGGGHECTSRRELILPTGFTALAYHGHFGAFVIQLWGRCLLCYESGLSSHWGQQSTWS